MKKLLCIILSIVISFSYVVLGFSAQPIDNSDDISAFVDGITKLSQEYDTDKEFEIVEDKYTDDITVNQFYSNGAISETKELNSLDFQTARLIVRANDNFDGYGALEHVSGFKDFHILQYESPEAAESAYQKYVYSSNITSVSPDAVISCLNSEDSFAETEETSNFNNWSLERTQSKMLQDYLSTCDIAMKEVVVAVIDSGIDYNHEIFQNRIERTEFNSSFDGTVGDEMDVDLSHGTAVASVVINNSLPNVKVAGYKVISNESTSTQAIINAGILKAIKDKVDVINLSLSFVTDSELGVEVLNDAFVADIPVVCAVGNSGTFQTILAPQNIKECITVSSTNQNNTISEFSDRTLAVDVSAPGENIYVATINNQYEYFSGTSFSSPCVAALVATMKSISPSLTTSEIENILKDTALPVKSYWNYYSDFDGKGIVQFCDALNVPTVENIQINLDETTYDTPQLCSLSCNEKNATILYTLDGTYPDISNGMVYESPLEITEYSWIRAITYYENTGYYGKEIDITIRIRCLGAENDFEITEDGIITAYNGNTEDLIVPESINGIVVSGFEKGVFNNEHTIGIALPSTVTQIPSNAFSGNTTIQFVEGTGITTIGSACFSGAEYLRNVSFSNATEIGANAFKNTYNFICGEFDKVEIINALAFEYSGIVEFIGPCVETINREAFKDCCFLENVSCPQWANISKTSSKNGMFYNTCAFTVADFPLVTELFANNFNASSVQFANLPSVKTMGIHCFYNCSDLSYINMPSLISISEESFAGSYYNPLAIRTYIFDSVETIEANVFGSYKTKRIEFSNLVSAGSLPQTEGCKIAMPSTFIECTEDTTGRNYKVYGSNDSTAETWAINNGHEFVEISQETAILEDVPMEYTGNGEILSPNVIGFNKTYQWYSNTEPNNTTGTPIPNAISKDFNPADYPESPYYYCVITSTDKGYDPVEIRTGVTKNTSALEKTILSPMSSQIRFTRNNDGSYANMFDVRTRAMIIDEDFKTYIADTNDEAELIISRAGFVYSRNTTTFSTEDAKKVAQGETVRGYTDAPVSYIQDADGYYMFTCIVTNIPIKDVGESVTAYAYICVDNKWYFFDAEVTADFNQLYSKNYPLAAEKYGW